MLMLMIEEMGGRVGVMRNVGVMLVRLRRMRKLVEYVVLCPVKIVIFQNSFPKKNAFFTQNCCIFCEE